MRSFNSDGFAEYSPGDGLVHIIETGNGSGVEQKEVEPKRVVFKLSLHIKELKIDEILGNLKDDLKPDKVYTQLSHQEGVGGAKISTKGGRSLKVLGQLAEKKGMEIVGIKWRADNEKQKDGRLDNGIGLVLEFGFGKSDFDNEENHSNWRDLAKKLMEEYLWDCIYYENGDRIGLFGPQKVVTKSDGTRSSDDPGKQMFLKDVAQTLADDSSGMKYTWGQATMVMPFQ